MFPDHPSIIATCADKPTQPHHNEDALAVFRDALPGGGHECRARP